MENKDPNELFVFSDKPDEFKKTEGGLSWKILIVDDDEEVHRLTKMVLSDYLFENTPVTLLHAYSKAETIEILKKEKDIALVLLDVVMETDDAGLECVKVIREVLENREVRIILRTGQPGQAPEKDVIVSYDINDYKSKTELTVQKMFTVVTASLRTFKFIKVIEQNRRGLENIISASSTLFELHSFQLFATGILRQLTAILQLEDNSLFINSSGMAAFQDKSETRYNIVAGTGTFAGKEEQMIEEIVPKEIYTLLMQAASEKQSIFSENTYVGYLESKKGEHSLLYLQWQRPLSRMERDLISIFASNVAIAFENISLNNEIIETQKEVIFTLTEVVEGRSKETGNHIRRVAAVAELLARKLGLGDMEVELVRLASPMHDIGKVGTPDDILRKPGKLTAEEYETMKYHATLGYQILKSSPRELMRAAAVIAYEHHEKWNGTGYPRGLKGEEIHIYGRIVALADVVDALVSKRCYKEAFEMDRVIEILGKEKGGHFDPEIVDLFLDSLEEYNHIRKIFPV